MSPALVERALRYVTIFGAAKIDPLAADPVVLAALPGVTPAVAKSLQAAQNGPRPDSATLAAMAGPVKDSVGTDPNDYVRAEIVTTVSGRRVRAEVVLKVTENEAAPYEILFWRDDFDGDETEGRF
jgi:general secretion pathway protein K